MIDIKKQHDIVIIPPQGAAETSRGEFSVLDTPLGDINLHFRGGYVLPVQQPANSTMFR